MSSLSIRWRLILSYALLTVVTVGMMLGLSATLLRQSVDQQERDSLQANADAIAQQAVPLMWPAPQPRALQQLARASAFLGNVRVRIVTEDQTVLADSGQRAPDTQEIMIDGKTFRLVRREDSYWGVRFVFQEVNGSADAETTTPPQAQPEAALVRVSQSAITTGNARVPTLGFVQVSNLRQTGSANLGQTLQTLGAAGIAALVCAVLIGLAISHSLMVPLRKLAGVSSRMAQGDLSARADMPGRQDEIGQLAEQFNQMAAKLQQSFAALQSERDALRHFIGDASHELRTPITSLKLYNELMRDGVADEQARAEFLAESEKQLNRLQWITQNLLDLSRLDAGLTQLNLTREDIDDVVLSVAASFKPVAADRAIELTVRKLAEPVRVWVDRARIEMALSNLIDNAVKFTPEHGRVEVAILAVAHASVEISVKDSGMGISAEDLPHVFERFYRGQATQAVPGHGLGLAIVQSVAQAHGGQVGVTSEVGVSSTFTLHIPIGKAPASN